MHEGKSQLPTHWRFAAANGFRVLQNLVRSFDFQYEVRHHAYVDITPAFFLEVIDGFLGENDTVIFPGERTDLIALRQILVERITPAFEQGKKAGHKYWQQSGCRYGAVTIEAVHGAALKAAPSDMTIRGWFAEGFSASFTREATLSVLNESGRGLGL